MKKRFRKLYTNRKNCTKDLSTHKEKVEAAIVYSFREDGVKRSDRSEDPAISARDLLYTALKGIGNGGGRDSMAGGFIKKDRLPELGHYPKDAIRDLVLKTLSQISRN